jgi:hypothetical protein
MRLKDNTLSFEYSEPELKFRRDIDLIQAIMPLAWSGCFIPEGLDIDDYNEIYQGSGVCGDRNFYDVIIDHYPWVKIYEAFFKNEDFEDGDIQIISGMKKVRMLLNGNEIVTRNIIGNYDDLLEVVTLSDAGHKNFETMYYLNRIIAAYGHSTIVDDARINPRYGRVDIDKIIHHAERYIPWRIKNDFKKGTKVEMIDWTGSAKIETRMMNKYNDPEGYSLKTSFYMGDSSISIGTMWSYSSYLINDFDYYYKQ